MYDVLGVAASAPQELVDHAYQMAVQRLQPLAAQGDHDAKNRLIAIKEAYRVVRTADHRALYDAELGAKLARQNDQAASVSRKATVDSEFSGWWRSGKTSWVMGGVLVIAALFGGRTYYASQQETQVRQAELAARAQLEQMRLENERTQVNGTINNQTRLTTHAERTEERRLALQEAAEARRNREVELRANAAQQRLDMQHRAQEARLDRDLERERKQAQRDVEQKAQAEKAAIDRENRYYTCMNSAISLYGADRARLRCSR